MESNGFFKSLKNMTFAQICSRYENHSPSTTQGNGTSSTSERDERNGTDKSADLNIKNEVSWFETEIMRQIFNF